jgi:hypothetical protein
MTCRLAIKPPALTEELGGQLRRLGAAGPKITQLLSMIQLEPPSGEAPALPRARRFRRENRFRCPECAE